MHLDPDPKHCNKAFTQASHSQHVNTPLLSNHNAWGGGGGSYLGTRAVDPHSFFAGPDPAAFLNTDPDQALKT